MAEPYLTEEQARARLAEYGIAPDVLTRGDLRVASNELDVMPLIGERYADGQGRAFPRSVTRPGDVEGEIPGAVLDWIALRAYQLSSDEDPTVTSEGAGSVSVSYARPKLSQTEKRMARLLAPYLVRRIRLLSAPLERA